MMYRLVISLDVPEEAPLAQNVANALRAYLGHLERCIAFRVGPDKAGEWQITSVVNGESYDVTITWKMQSAAARRRKTR